MYAYIICIYVGLSGAKDLCLADGCYDIDISSDISNSNNSNRYRDEMNPNSLFWYACKL